jgi:transposase
MLTMTNPCVTREQVWAAFRSVREVRLRERYHRILLVLDGKSGAEIAQWLYRDEETIRGWVHAVHTKGLPGLEREPIPGRPA